MLSDLIDVASRCRDKRPYLARSRTFIPEQTERAPCGKLRHPVDATSQRTLESGTISGIENLLEPIMVDGVSATELPPLDVLKQRRIDDLERLDDGVRRLVNPHIYHVSLSQALWDMKQRLIAEAG